MGQSFANRRFQVWEYSNSHSSLLIRSPEDPACRENIDLVCSGVRYLGIPSAWTGLELVDATESDAGTLPECVRRQIRPSQHKRILTQDGVFSIVALSFAIQVNHLSYFESPFPAELRPKFPHGI